MLFLISNFKILKVVKTEEQAFYFADLLSAKDDYYINDLTVKGLDGFTDAELRTIHNNHIEDYQAKIEWKRSVLVGAILNIMTEMEVDETPIYQLRAKLKREPLAPKIEPLSDAQRLSLLGDATQAGKGVQSAQRSTASTSGTKRPKPETTSGRIWAQCDLILNAVGFASVKSDIMDWGVTEDINPSTVRTQYGHWRRFNNLG